MSVGSNVRVQISVGSNVRVQMSVGSNVRVQMSVGSNVRVQTSGFKRPGFNRPSSVRNGVEHFHFVYGTSELVVGHFSMKYMYKIIQCQDYPGHA